MTFTNVGPVTYRKRPVEITACQLTHQNHDEIMSWISESGHSSLRFDGVLKILTLEGDMKVDIGDWVIKGVAGEFYPCKPNIFDATYECADA